MNDNAIQLREKALNLAYAMWGNSAISTEGLFKLADDVFDWLLRGQSVCLNVKFRLDHLEKVIHVFPIEGTNMTFSYNHLALGNGWYMSVHQEPDDDDKLVLDPVFLGLMDDSEPI